MNDNRHFIDKLSSIIADLGAIINGYIEENKRLRAMLAEAAAVIDEEHFPTQKWRFTEASK